MTTLKDIIEHIKKTSEETNISPTDNCILENSIKIYISNKIGQDKRENIQAIKEEKELKKIISEPATEKQIAFLKKNGYEGSFKLSKEEAKVIISEAINNKGEY